MTEAIEKLQARNNVLAKQNFYLTAHLVEIIESLKRLLDREDKEFPWRLKIVEDEDFKDWAKSNGFLENV